MFQTLSLTFHLAVAGLGSLIWHWGIGIGLLIIFAGSAVLSNYIPLIGPWLTKEREGLYILAIFIGAILFGEYIGIHDANKHHAAQQVVITNAVDNAVIYSTSPKVDNSKDPYDSPEN